MKSFLILAGIVMCLGVSVAYAQCAIEEKKEIEVGTDKGFKGMCPNSDEEVTCIFDDGWRCNGPHGEYSGSSDVEVVLKSACGC